LFLAFSLETSRSYTTLFINFSCTKNTCKTPYITLKIVSSRFPQVFPIFSRLSRSKFSIKTNDQCDWVACSVRDGTTFTFEDEVGLSDQRPTMRDRRKEGRKEGRAGLGMLPTYPPSSSSSTSTYRRLGAVSLVSCQILKSKAVSIFHLVAKSRVPLIPRPFPIFLRDQPNLLAYPVTRSQGPMDSTTVRFPQ
jgi:hypothetical protein